MHAALEKSGVGCRRFGGQLLVEPETIRNKSGEPFKVFTPFYKACLLKEPLAAASKAPRKLERPARMAR